jgi:transmembrane 9 superfamily protein 2/4
MQLLLVVSSALGFYFPGVSPHGYARGDEVSLLVNALSAEDSLVPYDYYYSEFHFCRPETTPVPQHESLGAILFGDRLFNSPFKIKALVDASCVKLCEKVKIPAVDSDFIYNRIKEEYMNSWMIGIDFDNWRWASSCASIFRYKHPRRILQSWVSNRQNCFRH